MYYLNKNPRFRTIENLNTDLNGGIHAYGSCRYLVEDKFYSRDVNRFMVLDATKTRLQYDEKLNEIIKLKIAGIDSEYEEKLKVYEMRQEKNQQQEPQKTTKTKKADTKPVPLIMEESIRQLIFKTGKTEEEFGNR